MIKNLSYKLTKEFRKDFTVTNLKNMIKFYLVFPNSHALRDQLSWTYYRLIINLRYLIVAHERFYDKNKINTKRRATHKFFHIYVVCYRKWCIIMYVNVKNGVMGCT